MKQFVLTIVLFQLTYFACGQENPDSLIRKLKIKKVSIMEGDRLVAQRKYDMDGYLINKMDDNFLPGLIKTTLVLTYDNNHNKTESKSTHSSYQGDTTYWVYQYDSANNLLAIEEGYKKSPIFKYNYDSLNKKVKGLQFDASGNIVLEESYKYNSSGLEAEHIFNRKNIGNRVSKTWYDTLNRVIKSETIDNNEKVIITTDIEYDEGQTK